MEYIVYENITGVHLEITTKCSSICAMCGRNFKGKVRDKLKLTELSLNDCKEIFSPNFLKQINFMSICGVYGDPIYASEILDIVSHFYSHNENMFINFYTNGSIHSSEWWGKLAKTMKNGCVVFGIDGVGVSHSIHRCTDYDEVLSNAKAYIDAGGKARWDYLVFKHNEHQVEKAKETSETMGFSSFQVKKTSRFFKNLYEKDPELDSTISEHGKHPIFNNEGEIINYLEMPTNPEYINKSGEKILELISKYGSIENYLNLSKIKCQAIKTKGVFVSALGEVFPCCTIYQQICYGLFYDVTHSDELNEFEMYKSCDLSAFNHTIKDIVEGDFFKILQKNWNKSSISDGKPKSCCRTCGIELDMHLAQHTNELSCAKH